MTSESTLRIALENVDFRLPTQVTDDNSVTALKSLVMEPLLRWQLGGTVKPGLFSSWTHTPDAKVWEFHIRDDCNFHDGNACTADDIVTYIHGLLESLDYFGMRWSYSRYFAKSKISAKDARTVVIENLTPFADVKDILCEFWPVKFDAEGKPVNGTGPYKVVEFERVGGIGRAKLRRVAREGGGPNFVEAIHERDGEKRLQLLKDGKTDVALNLERADDLEVVDFGSSLRWGRVTSTLSAMYYLSCTSGIFSNPEVRLAANLSVDNHALVKEVFQGLALPSATIVSPFHIGFEEANIDVLPYDPARARKLLEPFDISKLEPLKMRTPIYMPEHAQKITAFVSKALEAVGFRVNTEVGTDRPKYAHSIGWDKYIGDIACFDSTPNSTFRVLDDKISSSSKNTWWLACGYHDDAMQKLIGSARLEIEDGDRARAYARCLRRLQENPPWLYIAHPDVVWASRLDVKTKVEIGANGVLSLK